MSSGWSNPVLKVRALTEVSERRKRPSTYTDPLTKSPDMKEFLQEFYKNVYKHEKKEWYRAERERYPTLQKNYDDLCGKTVSYEDFWMRYERRCNLERVMKELADKDAAQVEQTKKTVSEYLNKAWITPSWTETASDHNDDGRIEAQKVQEDTVAGAESVNSTKDAGGEMASPIPSILDSVSSVLGKATGLTPTAITSPSQTKKKERVEDLPSLPVKKQPGAVPGIRESQEQNSILNELKMKLMGSSTKAKSIDQTTKEAPTILVEKSRSPSLSKREDQEYENKIADTAALLLLFAFIIVTNLPLN